VEGEKSPVVDDLGMGLLATFLRAPSAPGVGTPPAPLRPARNAPTRLGSVEQERSELEIRASIHPYLKRTPRNVVERDAASLFVQVMSAGVTPFTPITSPLAGDLTVEYGRRLHDGPGVDVVQHRHLAEWELSEFQLRTIAQHNLVRLLASIGEPEPVDGLTEVHGVSPFTSSLLLVDRFWELLAARRTPVIGGWISPGTARAMRAAHAPSDDDERGSDRAADVATAFDHGVDLDSGLGLDAGLAVDSGLGVDLGLGAGDDVGFVVCAPTHHHLVIADADNAAAVARLHVRCAQSFTRSVDRLSNTPLLRRNGEWTVYTG
jgi:hypothetical protein